MLSTPTKHRSECPARYVRCHNCKKMGHFAKLCQSQKEKDVRQNEIENDPNNTNEELDNTYNVDIFLTRKSRNGIKPKLRSRVNNNNF